MLLHALTNWVYSESKLKIHWKELLKLRNRVSAKSEGTTEMAVCY